MSEESQKPKLLTVSGVFTLTATAILGIFSNVISDLRESPALMVALFALLVIMTILIDYYERKAAYEKETKMRYTTQISRIRKQLVYYNRLKVALTTILELMETAINPKKEDRLFCLVYIRTQDEYQREIWSPLAYLASAKDYAIAHPVESVWFVPALKRKQDVFMQITPDMTGKFVNLEIRRLFNLTRTVFVIPMREQLITGQDGEITGMLVIYSRLNDRATVLRHKEIQAVCLKNSQTIAQLLSYDFVTSV